MSRHPEILWAQRSDKVYVTVELPDAKNAQVKVDPEGKFTFTATSKDAKYETELELFDKVDAEASKFTTGLRHTFCVIEKAEKKWWKRLVKGEGKAPPFVKADWNKWVDEDEEHDAPKVDDFDMSQSMNGFSNLDDNEDDSDDEEEDDLPDMRKAEV